MWSFILDLLFPIQCLGCSQEGDFLCPACFEKIPLNQKIIYFKKSPLVGLVVASFYEHPLLKEALYKYKYDFVKDLAKPLGQLMTKRLTNFSNIFNENNSVLIPVPLHKKRLRWRGFNQVQLLTEEISQKLKIPINNNILIRKKYSLPQMQIKDAQQRKRNIREAFVLGSDPAQQGQTLMNKTIILVDDVCTTGATLEECAQILKKAGAKKIWGLVLAQG
jgi:ComF family protein